MTLASPVAPTIAGLDIDVPPEVFKYLPAVYADTLLDGNVFFRNLIYFKKLEHDPRLDVFEGAHIDAPDHDVHIDNLTTGRRISGRFAFHNTLEKPDRVFCFCTSMAYDSVLNRYGDACIRIFNVPEFCRRLKRQLARLNHTSRLETPYLRTGSVVYFDSAKAAPPTVNIKDSRQLPFLKRNRYESDREFRFVFSRRRGNELKMMVVMDRREIDESNASRPAKEYKLSIGPIRDIATRIS